MKNEGFEVLKSKNDSFLIFLKTFSVKNKAFEVLKSKILFENVTIYMYGKNNQD